ncbi:hypothetical protein [Luteolibacter marinus]|uniref:hypothetical protein n=1 Tax=Luteolibacter marinus TaxID=2776705 RepID=UPI001866375D|nr:hypothetical protein [Luteolibacter marinus]
MNLLLHYLLVTVLVFGSPASKALARDEGEAAVTASSSKNKRTVRFLAVGDLPPFRQVVENGVRRELPPPAGSIPPSKISLSLADDGESELGSSSLQLGRVSAPVVFEEGAEDLVIRDAAAGGTPWVKVKPPESGDFLVVLFRDPEAKSWSRAKASVVPEGDQPGKATVLNVAPGPLAIVYGEDKIALVPGKPLVRNLAGGKPVSFQIGMPVAGGKLKRVSSMSLEQEAGERTFVVIGRADGIQPRQPLKVTVIRSAAES